MTTGQQQIVDVQGKEMPKRMWYSIEALYI